MTRDESRCGNCGHPKSQHTGGRGICSASLAGTGKPCRCSRFARPRLEIDDIELIDIVNLMIRGGCDHLVIELDDERDTVTVSARDEAGNVRRAPGETELRSDSEMTYDRAGRRLKLLLDLKSREAHVGD